jgi:hypothetical protein
MQPVLYLFALRGQGFDERYPEASVFDTSNHPLGEATSHAYGGGAWAVRAQDFAGYLPFNSPVIQYVSAEDPATTEEPSPSEPEDGLLCGCGGKGWEVFNADPDTGRLGDVQCCDCGRLPDEETAYESAASAGVLVDVDGNVLPNPWGAYADEVRRQRSEENLRQMLNRSGRLIGTCSPNIRFFALGKHVFCDKTTARVRYTSSLQDFEAMLANNELPGFSPA